MCSATGPSAGSNADLQADLRSSGGLRGAFDAMSGGLRHLLGLDEEEGGDPAAQAGPAAAPPVQSPLASPMPDGSVEVRGGGRIGPFAGEHEGQPRNALIAARLCSMTGGFGGATVEKAGGGAWAVKAGAVGLFEVRQADAQAGGFLDARLAAYTWAAALAQKPVPDKILGGEQGFLSKSENDALLGARSGVEVESGGTIVAHGVRLGPFTGSVDGRPRAEVIAERLGGVPSSAFRGAKAEGDKVVVGTTSFTVSAADAVAMHARTAAEGAKQQAGLIDGTWEKGAYDEPGRRVMPETMSSAALFEFARGVAEGPGHTPVSTDPGNVTIVGIRGVSQSGTYDPKLAAADDIVVPLVIDADGKRVALKLSGTVDPGGTSGGATQVGDASAEFKYGNNSGNKYLNGTGLMRPTSGIEGKDLNNGVEEYDDVGTGAYDQGATLIHFGTKATESRGCTVITDSGRYYDNQKELKDLHNTGIHGLDADTRLKGSDALGKQEKSTDKAQQKKVDGLAEMRRNEEAVAKKNAGESYDATALSSVSNYKAFLSMVYRDADLKVNYVIVDGSKIKELTLPPKAGG